ncbi:MAG: transcription antitermination factor NusB [Clostridia bacterium]|nr:transcription antitermination factor NusB [Clostridia bacterium]
MKALYQLDVGGGDPFEAVSYLALDDGAAEATRALAERIVEGVMAHRAEIDRHISLRSRDWRLERIAPVDRNILRIAVWELCHRPDVPAPVAIDEAVELAKTYGGQDSSRFVNGILGQLARALAESET